MVAEDGFELDSSNNRERDMLRKTVKLKVGQMPVRVMEVKLKG